MEGPDYERQDYRRETAAAGSGSGQDPSQGVEGDRSQGSETPVSSFELLRRVIVGVIQSIGDGAELISTSVAEEFVHFREDVEHRVIVILLFIAGILAVGVGVMLLLRQLIESWPVTLLIIGGCFLGVGYFLSYRWRPKGD
jgi:hypothetical protein